MHVPNLKWKLILFLSQKEIESTQKFISIAKTLDTISDNHAEVWKVQLLYSC